VLTNLHISTEPQPSSAGARLKNRPSVPHGRIKRSAERAEVFKVPERCPYCRSKKLTRKGVRRKKFETVQLWRCINCERVFTPTSGTLRNKTL
jgi:rubredoxin